MRDWLTIQCEKGENPHMRKFIQANPLLDPTMKTQLARCLNLSEQQSVQKWIEAYRNTTSKCFAVTCQNWSMMPTNINA